MKKKLTIIFGCLICIIFFLSIYFGKCNFYPIWVKTSDVRDTLSYYFDYHGQSVYLHGIDQITIQIGETTYDLKDAIENSRITFDEIFRRATSKKEYWDGGSTLYQYPDFVIVVCQKMFSDHVYLNSIIIGNLEMSVETYCYQP